MNLIVGIILGIVIATIGVSGVVNIASKAVSSVQTVAKEAAK